MRTINAYPRADGSFGIRNIVLVVSTVTCANTVAMKIAMQTNAVPLTHEGGCMESGKNHERTLMALTHTAAHPNVAGVLVVGLGCENVKAADVTAAVVKAGIPCHSLLIQEEGGSPETVQKGVAMIQELQDKARAASQQPCPVSGLVVGVQCGGSDWTTALAGNSVIGAMTDRLIKDGGSVLMSEVPGIPGSEHIVASRAVSAEAREAVLTMVDELRAEFMRKNGQRIEEVNPTPGNKAGGITTLVEKSMGNIKKMGTSPVQGVIGLGERAPHPGLWIVDNRVNGPDPINLAGFAMAGAHAVVFSTGRGSPVGNPVMPVVKITGNSAAFKKMGSILDFNAGVALEGKSIAETGDALYELLLETASGKATRSEENGNCEFTIPYDNAG